MIWDDEIGIGTIDEVLDATECASATGFAVEADPREAGDLTVVALR